jgi:membrane protease YdiL (CAAX protease family)
MTWFVLGTLILLVFLALSAWRSAIFLRQVVPTMNLLLLPIENVFRLVLIGVCIVLALISEQPATQFGWRAAQFESSVLIGLGIGGVAALMVPVVTHFAVARFGKGIYSPIIVQSILPRNRREWMLVPIALAPAVVLEELLFRSLLLGGFAVMISPVVLAIAWSIVFGAMHFPQGALGVVVAAGLGLMLSGLFLATQNLLAPIIAHYVINLVQLVWASQNKSWLESFSASSHL